MNKPVHIALRLIPIEEDGYHLVVSGKINRDEVVLLLDTGASRSVFDLNRVMKLLGEQSAFPDQRLSAGLGTNSMKTHSAVLPLLKIGRWQIKNKEVVLLDLSHVNESYQKLGHPPIDGVIEIGRAHV